MYEKVHKSSKLYGDISEMTQIPLIKVDDSKDINNTITNKSNVEKRILQLKKIQSGEFGEFDGSIDNLI